MIATNACSKVTSHAIIDSGASCRVTPHIEDLIDQPTPIQNTKLKGIAGGLTTLDRGNVQLKIQQENQENIIMIIYNAIYAPDCPIRLISPKQLHRQQRMKQQQPYITGEIPSIVNITPKQKFPQLAA
jgi:hypothetical protein